MAQVAQNSDCTNTFGRVEYENTQKKISSFEEMKFVLQVAHDRDTYATSNKSSQYDLKPLGIQHISDCINLVTMCHEPLVAQVARYSG